ncbi:MAG: hypothetical protein H6605_11265 [Flavobacteriales bacterium]|nr:hypothetical protein [Flavobacteriales bacterium]
MENTLGVRSPAKTNLLVVLSPVGAYYKTGFNPISVSCDPDHIRSAPGGTGGYKVGGYV